MTERSRLASVRRAAVLASIVVACGIVLMCGPGWRLGPSFWDLCLRTNRFGDEGREIIYRQIGAHGGPEAFDYLEQKLKDLLASGANDVELAGIIEGMVRSGDIRAENRFLELFGEFSDEPRTGGRYIALEAALGLQRLRGRLFEEPVRESSYYRDFALSNFAKSEAEAEAGELRFARLLDEIGRQYGVPSGPSKR